MRNIMEESPVVQEDPPNVLPLQYALKENDTNNIHWQDLGEKVSGTPNSRLLYLTVEYVQDENVPGPEYNNNYSPSLSENGRLSPFDPSLNSAGRYSPLYNALVIPPDQSQVRDSVVVFPSSAIRNESQQINIVVEPSQFREQLVVEGGENYEVEEKINLNSETSTFENDQHSGFVQQINCEQNLQGLGQNMIITSSPSIVLPEETEGDAMGRKSDYLDDTPFFSGETHKIVAPSGFVPTPDHSTHNEYPSPSNETVLINEGCEEKTLLDSSKYAINEEDNIKQDELLLSGSEPNQDLLMKNESLMEVDSYGLTHGAYITPEGANSSLIIDEQMAIKEDEEYLLPDAVAFEDSESSLLQPNLEDFPPPVLDAEEFPPYDKTRLRPAKKHPEEDLGLEYWCEDCEFGMKCSQHEVKIISDKPVPSRARATLPKELLAISKLHEGTNVEGVFARKTITRRVQFGPVEGNLLKNWNPSKGKNSDTVELVVEVEAGQLCKLDVSNENESNWMRFVRKAKTLKEQNLILTQQGKSLYFTTTRLIPARHELKVGYSPQYAQKRKLAFLENLPWHCFECPARFVSSDDLQKHLKVHERKEKEEEEAGEQVQESEKPNKRGRPSGVRRASHTSVRRRSTRTPNPEERENKCWNCHKIFPKTYSLKRHLLLAHSERDKENSVIVTAEKNEKLSTTNTLFKRKHSNGPGSEWLCTHCNLTFDNPSVLNLHILTHAAEDLESEAVLAGLPPELSSVYQEGEFLIGNGDVQCPQCTQEFPSKRQLIDHVSTHGKMTLKKCCPNPKPFKCEQCYKGFATDARLQKHMLVHGSEESKPYQCEVCSKRFLNNSALSCHRKIHNGKKTFECPLCKEEFEQVFGLREHVKIHATDGYFTCPECSKTFESYSLVRKHIRAFHSGLQHICKDCGKLCPTLDKLKMHSLKHSDHREFLCANCGKQFKRKDKLKEHMKRMHSVERELKLNALNLKNQNSKRRFTPKMSPLTYDRFIYKCRSCMVGFKRRGMLVNHLAKRHPDIVPDTVPELNLPILKTTRDYFCQYCDKIYKSSSKRKAHILKNHPGADLPMSNRQKGGVPYMPGMPNPTFSKPVGSVKTAPHGCRWCHKQYASKAKLLQHQRKKHMALLPKSQQVPRVVKNPVPLRNKVSGNCGISTQNVKWRVERDDGGRINEFSGAQIVQGVYTINGELSLELDGTYKKSFRTLGDGISYEYFQPAIAELGEPLCDYKLSFGGVQENLLKIIELKDSGGEGIIREYSIPATQMTRTWQDLPPYPPR